MLSLNKVLRYLQRSLTYREINRRRLKVLYRILKQAYYLDPKTIGEKVQQCCDEFYE